MASDFICEKCGHERKFLYRSEWACPSTVGGSCRPAGGRSLSYDEATQPLPKVEYPAVNVQKLVGEAIDEAMREPFEKALIGADVSAQRKATPLCTGVLDYFPHALALIAQHSKWGNDKHNPNQPLHWSWGKSADHADCIARHLSERGAIDPETGRSHTVALAWRALALLEEECVANGAPIPRGAIPRGARVSK